jgi:putative tryptophan/tyrosine transport system substrate-binding protein
MGGPIQVTENRRAGGSRLAKSCFLRLAALLVFCCAAGPSAWAEVVLLVEGQASIYQQAAQGFQQGFASADQFEQIYLEKEGRVMQARLDKLLKSSPRLVVAIGTQAAQWAKQRFPNVPILYCLVLHPVQNKLIGANIGGFTLDIELSQQFENIQKALPQVRRIGVVYDELTSGNVVRQAPQYLRPNVHLVARDARNPQEAARMIEELLGTVDAFWLLWDPVVANPANFQLLVEHSLKYKVALIAPARPFVEAGALMSVGADYLKAGLQTGRIAQQVLRSEIRPEDIMVLHPSDLVVTINTEVARRLGIQFPRDLRAEFLATP